MSNFSLKKRIAASFAQIHFFGNPLVKLKIVGVTGTFGKTSTIKMLYTVASNLGYKAGLISSKEIILIDEVRPNKHSISDALELNKVLKEMAHKKCEYVFMEVSSYALETRCIAGASFVGGVFTNLAKDHLEHYKNFNDYFKSKKKFFNLLPKSAFVLYNSSDEHGKKIVEDTKASNFSYGFYDLKSEVLGESSTKKEDFHGEIKNSDSTGLELDINGDKLKSKLTEKFDAYNLLTVWGTCHLLSFDMEKVKNALESIEPK